MSVRGKYLVHNGQRMTDLIPDTIVSCPIGTCDRQIPKCQPVQMTAMRTSRLIIGCMEFPVPSTTHCAEV